MVEVAKRIEYIDQNEHREKLKNQNENKKNSTDSEDLLKKEIMELGEDEFEPLKYEEDEEDNNDEEFLDSEESQEDIESEVDEDEEFDESFEEDSEEEFFSQNPLKAIWIKQKEIEERLDYLINSLTEENDGSGPGE